MQRYLDAVGVLTLVVMLPLCLGTLFGFLSGSITFDQYIKQYIAYWKEPMLLLVLLVLLVGFWLRGASDAPKP